MAEDRQTAAAFAKSWNHLPPGSVYTFNQFAEWLHPLAEGDVRAKRVLELGCGNASLLVHMAEWDPASAEGVDLGDAVESARRNMASTGFSRWNITQADLTAFTTIGADLVYCIGVLHHLADPALGFEAVIRNTKLGGRFHCSVYAWEGNALVRLMVEPLRRVCSRLPWWFTKHAVATPLAVPFYVYAKLQARFAHRSFVKSLPLHEYCLWIARREFGFFRHVAFDQLVTPQTTFIRKETIERWLATNDCIDKQSVYLMSRNGNWWTFGGKISCAS